MSEMFDSEYDIIELSITEEEITEEIEFPHIKIENLKLKDQVRGQIPEDQIDKYELALPVYADRKGTYTKFGYVELTAHNVLVMQFLGLRVSLIKNNSWEVNDFSDAESLAQIIKTLRVEDTIAEELEILEESGRLSTGELLGLGS